LDFEVPKENCALCHALQNFDILKRRKFSFLCKCPRCGKLLVALYKHNSQPSVEELKDCLALADRYSCMHPKKKNCILDFREQFPGHFAIHITSTSKEIAEFDLTRFWNIYIRFHSFVVSYLEMVRPEAIYKGRIIPEKAEGIEIFEIWRDLTMGARLSRKGKDLFQHLSWFKGILDENIKERVNANL
jgi:hypothetical protein